MCVCFGACDLQGWKGVCKCFRVSDAEGRKDVYLCVTIFGHVIWRAGRMYISV